jgi:hypothetical protein
MAGGGGGKGGGSDGTNGSPSGSESKSVAEPLLAPEGELVFAAWLLLLLSLFGRGALIEKITGEHSPRGPEALADRSGRVLAVKTTGERSRLELGATWPEMHLVSNRKKWGKGKTHLCWPW